ncbi:glycosyltransferase family 9 protein [bacterium]|nr:glycosyltransferase family 9 protein [bacterium]
MVNQSIPMSEIGRILIYRARFMGDVILTTPLLHVLRKHLPQSKITYLTESPYQTLLENHPDVDEILTYHLKNRWSQIKILSQLIHRRFDLVIDLFGNPRSALWTFLSGAPYRIGGHFRGRKIYYTHTIKDDGKPKSAVQFHLGYLQPLHLLYQVSDPFIVITENEKKEAGAYLQKKGYQFDQKIVVIHPGAKWPAKRWLASRFSALANRLVAETGVQIYFDTSPGEQNLVHSVIRDCISSYMEPEVLTLRQLAALLYHADLLISNDCGVMHLGPAVGTKTIGIFGPSEPAVWFPYTVEKGHRFIHHEIECSHCHRDFCDTLDCMNSIQVDDVFNEAILALNS